MPDAEVVQFVSSLVNDLIGSSDRDVLERAAHHGSVVVTHYLGFGHGPIAAGAAFIGIIYLRPGQARAPWRASRNLARRS
jgi:hypothetical protein